MARFDESTAKPIDQPHISRPGVMYPENNAPGDGKHLALPLDSPERKAKGDLPMTTIKDFEPRPLTHSGQPFALKPKGGR